MIPTILDHPTGIPQSQLALCNSSQLLWFQEGLVTSPQDCALHTHGGAPGCPWTQATSGSSGVAGGQCLSWANKFYRSKNTVSVRHFVACG